MMSTPPAAQLSTNWPPYTLIRPLDNLLPKSLTYSIQTDRGHRLTAIILYECHDNRSHMARAQRNVQTNCMSKRPELLPIWRMEWKDHLRLIDGANTALKPDHNPHREKPCAVLITEDTTMYSPLTQFIQSSAPIPKLEFLVLMRELTSALMLMALVNAPHGSIQPSCILIERNPQCPRIRLAGFGNGWCLTLEQLRNRGMESSYYPSNVFASETTIVYADYRAAWSCLVDVATLTFGYLKNESLESGLKKINKQYGLMVKQLFEQVLDSKHTNKPPNYEEMLDILHQQLNRMGWVKPEEQTYNVIKTNSATTIPPSITVNMQPSAKTHIKRQVFNPNAAAAAAASSSSSSSSSSSADIDMVDLTDDASSDPIPYPSPSPSPPPIKQHTIHVVYQGSQRVRERQFPIYIPVHLPMSDAWIILCREIETRLHMRSPVFVDLQTLAQVHDTNGPHFLQRILASSTSADAVVLVYDTGSRSPFTLTHEYSSQISIQPRTSTMTDDPGEYARAYEENPTGLPIAWSFGEVRNKEMRQSEKKRTELV